MNKGDKRLLLIGWLVLLVTLVAGLIFIRGIYKDYQDKEKQRRLELVNILRAAVNPEKISTLNGNETDLNNPDYVRLREQLISIANTSKDISGVYLLGFEPSKSINKMFFYVEGKTETTEIIKPGNLNNENNVELLGIFRYGGELISSEKKTSKQGSWVMVALPISEKDSGKIIALVRVDFATRGEVENVLVALLPGILILALVILLELVVFRIIRNQKTGEIYERHMASVLNYSEDAIYSCDLNGKILSWNKGAEEIFGYSETEILGKEIISLTPSDLLWETENNMLTVKQGKSVMRQRTKRLNKWGDIVDVSLNWTPIFDKSMMVIGISMVTKNIGTEQKRLEELEKKDAELRELNALMVNREIKMIELKKRIEELETKINEN